MSGVRTAWHPPFTLLLTERCPRWVSVTAEVPLTQEPLRADDLLVVRVDVPRDPNDVGRVLRGLWPHLRHTALLEFKSVARPFRRGDLMRLVAYGMLWLSTRQSRGALAVKSGQRRRAEVGDIALVLVVPSLSRTLRREIERLSFELRAADDGYHRVEAVPVATMVVALDRAAVHERDELMAWFAGRAAAPSLEARRWIVQNVQRVIAMEQSAEDLEGYDELIRRFVAKLSVKTRLEGIDAAQRLAGLDPAQRLAGLDPAHQVLALSDVVLRALSPEFIATLPAEVQATIRARLAGATTT